MGSPSGVQCADESGTRKEIAGGKIPAGEREKVGSKVAKAFAFCGRSSAEGGNGNSYMISQEQLTKVIQRLDPSFNQEAIKQAYAAAQNSEGPISNEDLPRWLFQ